jgi:hypothetical protein
MKTIKVYHGSISFYYDGKYIVIDTNGFIKLNPNDLRRISNIMKNTANEMDEKFSY